jgi:hypothetical protein
MIKFYFVDTIEDSSWAVEEVVINYNLYAKGNDWEIEITDFTPSADLNFYMKVK